MKLSDGSTKLMRPHEIVCNQSEAIELNAPRSDLNCAMLQFLIGLVQTTMAPEDDEEWVNNLSDIPSEDTVRTAFSSVSHCFNLFGDSSRFMQDTTLPDDPKIKAYLIAKREGKAKENNDPEIRIEKLAIGSPGDNTLKKNCDLFVKRNSIESICPSCAAMTLFAVMTNGPSMGRNHLTGLRGGGPLTTIVEAVDEKQQTNLQRTIWLNVLPKDYFFNANCKTDCEEKLVFPWLNICNTEKFGELKPNEVSQLQIFWATPLRIYLNLESSEGDTCDICGCSTDHPIKGYYSKTFGYKYESNIWYDYQTLSPVYKDTIKNQWLPRHLNPSGLSYRDWIGIVQNTTDDRGREKSQAAKVVLYNLKKGTDLKDLGISFQLHSFGCDFDKADARCWYDRKMRLYVTDQDKLDIFFGHAKKIATAASEIEKSTHGYIREARYRDMKGISTKDSKRKKADLRSVHMQFWSETEELFYKTLDAIFRSISSISDINRAKCKWITEIRKESLRIFDENTDSSVVQNYNVKNIVSAHTGLKRYLYSEKPLKMIDLDKEVYEKYRSEVKK